MIKHSPKKAERKIEMKLSQTNLRDTMSRLAHDGDRESYDKLWEAIIVLWNLGLVDDRLHNAMIQHDHYLFESGEAAPMCDAAFSLDELFPDLAEEVE